MSKTTTASGLVIEELNVGTGTEAAAGNDVTVHDTGWLFYGGEKGKKFHRIERCIRGRFAHFQQLRRRFRILLEVDNLAGIKVLENDKFGGRRCAGPWR